MSRENHLKLVVSNPTKKGIFENFLQWFKQMKEFEIKIPFLKTKSEKLAAIKKYYNQKFRNEDIANPEKINIPYFLRADSKLAEIKKNNAINTEYKKILGLKRSYAGCL